MKHTNLLEQLLCQDNWFAFQIYRFGGLHDFELEMHHAYGE